MSFGYIKYISLLIFSGLILTFYRANAPHSSINSVTVLRCGSLTPKGEPFRLLDDFVLPLFPALNTGRFTFAD